jgi:hypothetical protein
MGTKGRSIVFTRVWPLGLAFGEILYSTDMNTLDEMLPFALDTRGGTYNNGPLELTGGYVQINTLRRANGWSPWPNIVVLEDAASSGLQPSRLIDVYICDAMTEDRVISLSNGLAIHGNLQLFVKSNVGSPTNPTISIYNGADNSLVTSIQGPQWALTHYHQTNGFLPIMNPPISAI